MKTYVETEQKKGGIRTGRINTHETNSCRQTLYRCDDKSVCKRTVIKEFNKTLFQSTLPMDTLHMHLIVVTKVLV